MYRMEATNANLTRYPHVRTLPRFDVLTPNPGITSAYGEGVALQSVANNDRTPLEQLFPAAFRQ